MGISYAHYIIPRDQTVRPKPDQVAALIQAWIENGYVAQPTSGQIGTGVRFMTNPLFGDALERAQLPKPPSVGWWTAAGIAAAGDQIVGTPRAMVTCSDSSNR